MLAVSSQLQLTSDFPLGQGAGSLSGKLVAPKPTAAALEGTTLPSPPWGFGGAPAGKAHSIAPAPP